MYVYDADDGQHHGDQDDPVAHLLAALAFDELLVRDEGLGFVLHIVLLAGWLHQKESVLRRHSLL